ASWAISAANAGSYTSTNTLTFSNVENLAGGTGADSFTFGASGSLGGTIDGGGGSDTITGNDAGNAFAITGANARSITTLVAAGFSNVENLAGGTGADSFAFTGSGSVSGAIDGDGGSDTLDFSAVGSQAVVLTAEGATDGFNGTDGLIGGGFKNVNAVVGSSAGPPPSPTRTKTPAPRALHPGHPRRVAHTQT